jgi:hypothetical protein
MTIRKLKNVDKFNQEIDDRKIEKVQVKVKRDNENQEILNVPVNFKQLNADQEIEKMQVKFKQYNNHQENLIISVNLKNQNDGQ